MIPFQKVKLNLNLSVFLYFSHRPTAPEKSLYLKALDAQSLRVKSGLNKKELLANKAFKTELEYYENKFAMEKKIA